MITKPNSLTHMYRMNVARLAHIQPSVIEKAKAKAQQVQLQMQSRERTIDILKKLKNISKE